MKRSIKALFIVLLTLTINQTNGTHIVGGELTYRCVDPMSYTYEVNLKFYRNCSFQIPSSIPFADSIYVGIYDSDSVQIATFPMGLKMLLPPTTDTLINFTYNPCTFPPPNMCVEVANYQAYINLPPRPGGYLLMFQQCCRNAAILNISNPLNHGASWVVKVPDTAVGGCNSSAYFRLFPPTVICVNEQIIFDHNAVDSDGDSLVYSLCSVMDGSWGDGGAMLLPPDTIPKFPVGPYVSGYTYTNPLSGVDSLKIDPVTGMLSGVPPLVGQFVFGVCVSEYRDGTLLSVNKREFQFNVADCDTTISVDFSYFQCESGKTVNFLNLSTSSTGWPLLAVTYDWDFGVSGTNTDTSNLKDPSYTFPDTGSYNVSLTVNKGYSCETTYSSNINVTNNTKNKVTINVNGNLLTASHGLSFRWYLNDTLIAWANSKVYSVPESGTYYVAIIDSNGCPDTSATVYITVGIEHLAPGISIKVFPNPSQGKFSLVWKEQNSEWIEISLFDITGRQRFSERIPGQSSTLSKTIDVESLGKGIYFLRVIIDEAILYKKVVLQ